MDTSLKNDKKDALIQCPLGRGQDSQKAFLFRTPLEENKIHNVVVNHHLRSMKRKR